MKIGLVLGGGGARGAYQIGVWQAFKELDIDKYIKVIAGTSIGALNGILIKQGDIKIAGKLWNEITKEKILPTDNKDLIKKSALINIGSRNLNLIKKYMPNIVDGGDVSRSGLLEIFDQYIDFEKLKSDDIDLYVTCTEIPKLEAAYFKINNSSEEDMRKMLLATSAIPMIYKSEEINGKRYLDGGMVDNLPIQPVYGEGCDLIIVVPLAKDYVIDRNLYPNTDIIEIRPSLMEEGFIDGALEFTKDNSLKRMKLGYQDTIAQLSPIFKLANFIRDNKPKEDKGLFKIFKEKFFNK